MVLLSAPEFDAVLRAAPAPAHRSQAPNAANLPTEVDLWLVDLAYEVLADESRCARCGAALGAPSRLAPSAYEGLGWSVPVLVRCRGRWRHRHVATATRRAQDLVLGPLRTV